MPFGFRINDPSNRLLVDENHPIYFYPRYTVYQSQTQYAQVDNIQTATQSTEHRFWFTLTFNFDYPVFTDAAPLLFIRQNYTRGVTVAGAPYGTSDKLMWHPALPSTAQMYPTGYLNNLSWEGIGSPGRWTGIRVTVAHETITYQRRRVGREWWETFYPPVHVLAANTPDFRHTFVPAIAGASPPTGHGIAVYDANGRPVFHSNDNMLVVTNTGSSWTHTLNHRSYWWHDIYYMYVYRSNVPATSSRDLLLLTHPARTRRNEGGIAYVAPHGASTYPEQILWFGRWDDGGAVANTTTLWARPMHDLIYRVG